MLSEINRNSLICGECFTLVYAKYRVKIIIVMKK